MKRSLMMTCLLVALALPAPASEETVSYKSGDETVSAFLARPDGKGPFRRYSLELAVQEPGLAAAVAYYGAPPTEAESIAKIKAPVLGNFGGDDKGPAPDVVRGFETAMKKAGKSVDIKIYDGAGHAFANVNNPWGGYREAAATDAWARTTAFFAKHLKQ